MDSTHSTREREDKRISVFCLITALTGGGAEMVLYRLMARLDRSKFNPQVVSMIDLGPVSEKIRDLGIAVRSLGMSQGMPNPLAVIKLVRWLQCDKPDVIQTWMYTYMHVLATEYTGAQQDKATQEYARFCTGDGDCDAAAGESCFIDSGTTRRRHSGLLGHSSQRPECGG